MIFIMVKLFLGGSSIFKFITVPLLLFTHGCYYEYFDMKGEKRNSIFDRKSRDLDRNMKIIKKKTFDDPKVPKEAGWLHENISSDKSVSDKNIAEFQPLNEVVKKVHVQQKVKQFVSKLKRNNFSHQMEVMLEKDD